METMFERVSSRVHTETSLAEYPEMPCKAVIAYAERQRLQKSAATQFAVDLGTILATLTYCARPSAHGNRSP